MSERNAVLASEDGRRAYGQLVHHSARWRAYIQQLPAEWPDAPLLVEDLFYALYEEQVELNPDVKAGLHRHFAFIATLLPLADFHRLREETVGDGVTAALAVRRFIDEWLAQVVADEKAQGSRSSFWRVVGRKVALRSRFWGKSPRREDEGLVTVEKEMSGAPPQARLVGALHQAAVATTEDRRLRAVWGAEAGVSSVHVLDDVWTLVDDIRSLAGFEQLTDVLLRLDPFMYPAKQGRQRRPRRGGRGLRRLQGLTRGSDLERVAPEEFVRLLDDDLSGLFHDAYEHRRLLQERYDGERPHDPGPLVCCIDVSRSMNKLAARGKERFIWAKGMSLALLDAARRSRRPFLAICFSSEYDLAQFEVPVGGYRPHIAIELARCDFDGGTHFQAPLLSAASYLQRQHNLRQPPPLSRGHRPIRSNRRNFGQIVFITDGEAALPKTFVQRFEDARRAVGFQLLTVFIEGQQAELIALSDKVFSVKADRIESWEQAAGAVARAVAVNR